MVNPPVNVKVFIHPLMSLSRSNQKNQRANRLSINSPSSFLNQGTLPKDIYFIVFFVNVDFRPRSKYFRFSIEILFWHLAAFSMRISHHRIAGAPIPPDLQIADNWIRIAPQEGSSHCQIEGHAF